MAAPPGAIAVCAGCGVQSMPFAGAVLSPELTEQGWVGADLSHHFYELAAAPSPA